MPEGCKQSLLADRVGREQPQAAESLVSIRPAPAGLRAWRPCDHRGPWISKRPGLPSNRLAGRSTGPALNQGRSSDPSATPSHRCGRRILGDRPSRASLPGLKPRRMLPQSQGSRLRRRCVPSQGPASLSPSPSTGGGPRRPAGFCPGPSGTPGRRGRLPSPGRIPQVLLIALAAPSNALCASQVGVQAHSSRGGY
jgi:hypothetical protein